MEKSKNRWIAVAVVSAVVAALVAVVVLLLRSRCKCKKWYDQEPIDCDFDDCECLEFDDAAIEVEETIVEE